MKLSRKIHSANVLYGFERERRIARYLSKCGADVTQSPGSKGPYDIEVRWRSCVWLVQVKSSRTGVPRWLSKAEKQLLLQCSRSKKAKAIVALSSNQRTFYYSASTKKRIFLSQLF
jgi:Holliday junction resolvase